MLLVMICETICKYLHSFRLIPFSDLYFLSLRWSGTPMITMKGDKMASRVAASVLGAVGLGRELVVNNYSGEYFGG